MGLAHARPNYYWHSNWSCAKSVDFLYSLRKRRWTTCAYRCPAGEQLCWCAMAWQPEQASLAEILRLLKESQSHDTETQRSIEQVGSPSVRYAPCPWARSCQRGAPWETSPGPDATRLCAAGLLHIHSSPCSASSL